MCWLINIYFGSRGSGITTDLLLRAVAKNTPILVPTEANKKHIQEMCDRLSLNCPEVFTVYQCKMGDMVGIENIVISDFDIIFKELLRYYGFRGEIKEMSMSGGMGKFKRCKWEG